MSLRDEFEKLRELPQGVIRSDVVDGYAATHMDFIPYAEHFNSMYQGFLLGRRNTVSVEKYQEVWNAYVEAKRRTEEV